MFLYTINIKVNSKKLNQLKQFLIILKLYKIKCRLNLKLFMFFNVRFKKKKVAVLKSPHVHKKSQEHYSLNDNTFFFKISSNLSLKKLILFLKLFNVFFLDVSFKLHFKFFFKKLVNKNKKNLFIHYLDFNFNPNKFIIINSEFMINYLKIIENFGEFKLLKHRI